MTENTTLGSFLCPRRKESYIGAVHKVVETDTWRRVREDNFLTCSWCGSAHPSSVMAAIETNEVEIGPTDKDYKIYLKDVRVIRFGTMAKFYFQHFNDEQKKRFVDLLNAKRIRVGYPGYFYVLPFFTKQLEKAS